MERDEVRHSSRRAGAVKRYHTWPVLVQQTVADHTWHVMRIFYELWGPLPPEVSTFIIWHDAFEVVTGDPPFPIKREVPELAEILNCLDEETAAKTGWPRPELSPDWKRRVKICDLLEMHEYGWDELRLGNEYARPIINGTMDAIIMLVLPSDQLDLSKLLRRAG